MNYYEIYVADITNPEEWRFVTGNADLQQVRNWVSSRPAMGPRVKILGPCGEIVLEPGEKLIRQEGEKIVRKNRKKTNLT